MGARRATPYGIGIAERFAEALAAAGYSIVSGLARGVDAAAHRGALRGGGQTVAVLGSAHDRLYPPEHRDLARRCAAAGVVVTEFPPGTRPLPHHFPRRNRIIAGLAQLTLVVEAAERSGSLSTARAAVESNRDVFAVPGPVGAPLSAGCHALLRDGAGLAASPEDILAELPPLENRPVPGADRESRDEGAGSDPGGGDRAIGGHAATVLAALRRFPGGVGLDDLLAHARLPVPTALAAVSELERRGRVRRFPGGFYRRLGDREPSTPPRLFRHGRRKRPVAPELSVFSTYGRSRGQEDDVLALGLIRKRRPTRRREAPARLIGGAVHCGCCGGRTGALWLFSRLTHTRRYETWRRPG